MEFSYVCVCVCDQTFKIQEWRLLCISLHFAKTLFFILSILMVVHGSNYNNNLLVMKIINWRNELDFTCCTVDLSWIFFSCVQGWLQLSYKSLIVKSFGDPFWELPNYKRWKYTRQTQQYVTYNLNEIEGF